MRGSDDDRAEFDAIVLGVGGMGSAACLSLSRRGLRVLGLDQFPLVHDRGSSHGESRIIRKAYFEHPDYVPLLHRAYELWDELEQSTGRTLFQRTGLILSGPASGETIYGARLAATQHRLELENLSHAEARQRFPCLTFPEDHEIAFEPAAGTLFVDDCVQAQVDQAICHGAILRGSEPVLGWSADGEQVSVRTATKLYSANSLVVTAGAWAGHCLADVGLPLNVVRKFVGWYPVHDAAFRADRGLPMYFFELPAGAFYGFPSFDGLTIKVAEHTGGENVSNPLQVDRGCLAADVERLSPFVEAHLNGAESTPVRHSTCLYTMTPDRHFVIDRHPQWKNVAFAAGFSGHGFKFCPVVGEVLADLILTGTSTMPIQFLARQRAGLQPTSE